MQVRSLRDRVSDAGALLCGAAGVRCQSVDEARVTWRSQIVSLDWEACALDVENLVVPDLHSCNQIYRERQSWGENVLSSLAVCSMAQSTFRLSQRGADGLSTRRLKRVTHSIFQRVTVPTSATTRKGATPKTPGRTAKARSNLLVKYLL